MLFTRANGSLFLSMCFRYKAIVKYKTAFYSFYLPVAAAMYIVSGFIYIVFSECGGINGQEGDEANWALQNW